MKRSRSITLVLLGGGIVLAGCGEGRQARECREATEAARPDATQICARQQYRSGSFGSYMGAWFLGRTASNLASRSALSRSTAPRGSVGSPSGSVSRGGFGSRGYSGG